jgi:YbbR domain-containing protein
MTNLLREALASRFTREDVTRLIASFILAVLLWGWVSISTDPEVNRLFPDLTLQYEPLPPDLQLVTTLPTIDVRLTGPESVVEDVNADQISARIETGDIDEPGPYDLPVQIDTPDDVRKREAFPERVAITVERTTTDTFPLEYELEELPPTDARRIGPPVLSASEVTVSGPESAVGQVARVVLPIEIGTRNSDFEASFTPVARDANNVPVSGVEIAPDRVSATVPISERGKSVAVLIPPVQGVPADGFEVVDRTASPSTVLVDGSSDVLAAAITVSTQPVDVSGASANVTERVPLDLSTLPEGATVIEPADGTILVVVQITQRALNQTLPDQPVTYVGLAPDLSISVDPKTVDVTVVATEEQLQQLEARDIAVAVDVTGLGPGTHELAPKVSIPANMRWVRTDPERVLVTLEPAEEPTGTPAATPEASPQAVLGDPVPLGILPARAVSATRSRSRRSGRWRRRRPPSPRCPSRA